MNYTVPPTTGLKDSGNKFTGFPVVLPPTANDGTFLGSHFVLTVPAVGYFAQNLIVQTGSLRIRTTDGTFYKSSNNQMNGTSNSKSLLNTLALGFRLPVLSATATYLLEGSLVNIQKLAFGEFQNAGIYFGTSDDLIVRIGFVDVDTRARVESLVEYNSNLTEKYVPSQKRADL